MKTAISLPDALFRAGDALARRLHVSRSELYARALADYVARNRADDVTQRLNAVYADDSGTLDPGWARAQAAVLPPGEW